MDQIPLKWGGGWWGSAQCSGKLINIDTKEFQHFPNLEILPHWCMYH